jgi:tRNA(fMet)-specific endonuclease VapC
LKYLLDTNICIYIIKQKDPGILRKLQSFKTGEIGISSITLAELEYGVARSAQSQRNRLALASFRIPFEVVDFDQEAAIDYGLIRAWLEKEGRPIGSMDMLLAAQARSKGIVLVTNNEKEFGKIPGLQLENWTE